MKFPKQVKQFIERHVELIDEHDYNKLVAEAANTLPDRYIEQVAAILEEVGIDIKPYQLQLFDMILCARIDSEKADMFNDKANSWSRLNWMLQAIGRIGLKYSDILEHLKQDQARLGLNIRELPLIYSWDGSPDYDLGWFQEQYYVEG